MSDRLIAWLIAWLIMHVLCVNMNDKGANIFLLSLHGVHWLETHRSHTNRSFTFSFCKKNYFCGSWQRNVGQSLILTQFIINLEDLNYFVKGKYYYWNFNSLKNIIIIKKNYNNFQIAFESCFLSTKKTKNFITPCYISLEDKL